jgi:hypothetical protein
MADRDVPYDVAISFLAKDESIAAAVEAALAGLKVFFFPHQQEELIGTNGLESMREPFLKARVLVVLYRTPWGETPWTGVEQTAITDRCLRASFRPLIFVQLDKSALPKWLPDTHIRCVYDDYGIEQLVGAIKVRVQEQGGEIKQATALEEARRVRRQADFFTDRDNMMRDRRWIEQEVHRPLRETMAEVVRLIAELRKETGLEIVCGAKEKLCVLRYRYVSLAVSWSQPVFNIVSDHPNGECNLLVVEFVGTIMLPGEQEWVIHDPTKLKEHKFKVDVSQTRELVWVHRGTKETIPAAMLAEKIVKIMLDLMSRVDQGKVRNPF